MFTSRGLAALALHLAALALLSGTSRGDPADHGVNQTRFRLLRARARQALASLAPPGGAPLTVRWAGDHPTPVSIRGLSVEVSGDTSERRARSFLRTHPRLISVAGSQLRHVDTRSTRTLEAVRFRQVYRGIPVEGATIVVALDGAGRVRAIRSSAVEVQLSAVRPALKRSRAIAIAARQVSARTSGGDRGGSARLAIITGGAARLVYSVRLPLSVDPQGRRHLVDAVTGRYIGWRHGVLVDGRTPGGEVGR